MDIPLVPCSHPYWLATDSKLTSLSCRSSLNILRMDCMQSLLCDMLTPFGTMVAQAQPTSVSWQPTVAYTHFSVSSLIPTRTLCVWNLLPGTMDWELQELFMAVLLFLPLHKLKNNSCGVQYIKQKEYATCFKNIWQVKYSQWPEIPYGHEVVWHMGCKDAFHPSFWWNCEQRITWTEDETIRYEVKMYYGLQL
jgi:hypothetical protein